MTALEYLSQARRLDQRIDSDIEELGRLREMSRKLSAASGGEKVSGSRPNEAPFVRAVEKILEMEKLINDEIDILVDLKEQMRNAIATLPSEDERLAITRRFIHGESIEAISKKLNISFSTAKRRYNDALMHFVLPDNPIMI